MLAGFIHLHLTHDYNRGIKSRLLVFSCGHVLLTACNEDMAKSAIYLLCIIFVRHTGEEDWFIFIFGLYFIKFTSPLNPSHRSSLLNSKDINQNL